MDDHTALWQVLLAAHQQAMSGKGKDRHGGGLPFDQQPIMAIARMLDGSADGHLYQIMKKAQEAGRMARRGERDAAVRELHGAIVYAAAAVMVLEEQAAPPAGLVRGGHILTATEVRKREEDARTAIDRALEELGCQEHEIDHNTLRATMRKQREKIAEEAIDRAGEKHVAGGNKHGGSDNG